MQLIPGVAAAQQMQNRGQFGYDPADCGSYPSRAQLYASVWHDLAAASTATQRQQQDEDCLAEPAAAVSESAEQNPFCWVPDSVNSIDTFAEATTTSVRPKTAQIRSKKPTSLPLEWFDSPDMQEQSRLQQQLFEAQAAGTAGLPALSRFYSPQGSFSWAPCTLVQYDRCDFLFIHIHVPRL
jgi:hypothetical protein